MPAKLSMLASSALRFITTKSLFCVKREMDEVMSWILYKVRIKILLVGEDTPALLVLLMEESTTYLNYN